MCVSLCQLAPPHPNPPANLLLICKVSSQDATVIAPHPHAVDSRTSQRGEEWWENVGFRNKLNSHQQENHELSDSAVERVGGGIIITSIY